MNIHFWRVTHHFLMIFDFHTVDGCEILHQLIDGKHPIIPLVIFIYRFQPSKIGGAGFRNHPAAISSTQRIFPESNGSFSSHDPLVFRMAMEVHRYYIYNVRPPR